MERVDAVSMMRVCVWMEIIAAFRLREFDAAARGGRVQCYDKIP